MLRVILLALILPSFAQAQETETAIVGCHLVRTDARVVSLMFPLDDSLKDSEAVRFGTVEHEGLQIDYFSEWGPVPCEDCRAGHMKATTYTLTISRGEQQLEGFHFEPGEATQLKKVRGYKSISCEIVRGDEY